MIDLLIYDTLDGSDHEFKGADLVTIQGLQNMVYLGMFGGNKEQSTKEFNNAEQHFDYWANDLFFKGLPSIQFNSETERLLDTIVVSTEMRPILEKTVKQDLDFMAEFAEIAVSVSITAADRYQIDVAINEPTDSQSFNFSYIWDNTIKEMKAL